MVIRVSAVSRPACTFNGVETATGPADWRRQILKIVLELELVLDCQQIWLLNKRYIIWLSVSQRLSRGLYMAGRSSEFEED